MSETMRLRHILAWEYLRSHGLRGVDSAGKPINPPYIPAVQTNIRVTIERAKK